MQLAHILADLPFLSSKNRDYTHSYTNSTLFQRKLIWYKNNENMQSAHILSDLTFLYSKNTILFLNSLYILFKID